MILLLGGSGYIGSAFVAALKQRALPFVAPRRGVSDYTRFDVLQALIKEHRPALVINAAGFTGRPNVDACETARTETLLGNSVLPAVVGSACESIGVPFGQVSSGCIYTGARVTVSGRVTIERDLNSPEFRARLHADPGSVSGFTEDDQPNFSFRFPPCSFYSGSKALGEEAIEMFAEKYVWRLRIPFDEFDCPRNYLTKLQRYTKLYENINSVSHRGDFVNACLDLWSRRAPFGAYNICNPGFVSTHEVVQVIREEIAPDRVFDFWRNDAEFYAHAAVAPRSNCILDTQKLAAAGVHLRPVRDALKHALQNWQPEPGALAPVS
jgi:dTDP-4-dehydrorhamnose reductase